MRYSTGAANAAMLFALLALSAGPAFAQPDCGTSFINPPIPLGRSPQNSEVDFPGVEYTYSITLLDAAGDPVVGWPAADVALAVGPACPNPVVLPPDADSDAGGVMTWGVDTLDLPGGTCVGAAGVMIISAGCAFPIPYVVSPDENGDGVIGLADFALFRPAFFAGGPVEVGDLSRDGIPGLADLVYFRLHFFAF